MPYYPEDVIRDVTSGNDIVDVISSYVELKKRGSNYFGLCPFHREKSASFCVNPLNQFYHCFGCNAGGSVINFIMRHENLTFPDAVKMLADRIGYTLPETGKTDLHKEQLRKRLYELHKTAARYFYSLLESERGAIAVDYLEKRKINLSTRKKFGLGFSSSQRDGLYKHLISEGFNEEEITASGLVVSFDNGYRDKFFSRLMFPIIDVYGNIIGFGGRVLDDGKPKYLNSPETLIFSKSNNLFNLNNARRSGVKEFILVEGYMDVITIYQAGFKNVVASLGTAFNERHARVLRKYCESVILLFDSDDAGVNAVLRAIPVLMSSGLRVKVLQVHSAKDPDEFIKKFGAEEFGKLVEHSENEFVFRVKQLLKEYDVKNIDDKIAFTNKVVSMLKDIENEIEASAYIKEISRLTDIDTEAIKNQLQKQLSYTPSLSINAQRGTGVGINSALRDVRRSLLNMYITSPTVYDVISEGLDEKFLGEQLYKDIFNYVTELREKGIAVTPPLITGKFDSEEEGKELSAIFMLSADYKEDEAQKAAKDQINTLKKAYYEDIIKNSDDDDKVREAFEMLKIINR